MSAASAAGPIWGWRRFLLFPQLPAMPFWDRLFQTQTRGNDVTLRSPFTLLGADGVPIYAAGAYVDESTALQSAAVLACVRLLAGTLAGLPLHAYKRVRSGKERDSDSALAGTLAAPNSWQTGYRWRETLWQWVLLYGNAPNRIVWDRRGEPAGLEPLEPWNVTYKESAGGDLVYRYSNPRTRQTEMLGAGEVLHVRGLTSDGKIGYGVVEQLMRQSLGLTLTLQESAATFYGNASMLSGVVTPGKNVTPQSRDAFLKSWNTMHQGPRNAGRVALLDFGDKYQPIQVPPDQAQFLESRQYSTLEIARAFGVPPHLIGVADSQSYASAEQNNLEFVQYTLLPYLRNFEDEVWRGLIVEDERKERFVAHVVAGLLRGDIKSRYEAYAVGVQNGWINRNEVRSLEDMNEEPGLDEFLAPLNMTTAPALAAQAEQTIEGPPEPAPAPVEALPQPPAPTPTRRALLDDDGALVAETSEEDDDPEPEEGVRLTEGQRAARKDRQGLAQEMMILWDDAAGRLVKREVADLRRKMATLQPFDAATFSEWMEEFYRDLQPKIPAYFAPVLKASIKAALRSVERELGRKVTGDFEEFIAGYLSNLSADWVGSSQGQLGALLEENADPALAGEAIGQRVDEWEEKRPGKTGRREAYNSINAGAVESFVFAGVAALVWAARGKSCGFCRRMHGRRVATGQPFVQDATLTLEDGQSMRVYGAKKHGSLHDGCDCTIVAAG